MNIEIYEYNQDEIDEAWFNWSCGLWWSDFEEANIERCYIAWDGDIPVGFQTINGDGLCVAIEVSEEFQGQGIGRLLVEESGCWKPDRNECPEFWTKMAEEFGW